MIVKQRAVLVAVLLLLFPSFLSGKLPSTYLELKRYVDTFKHDTLDELLDSLVLESEETIRNQYVLLYRSRSLQAKDVSESDPRIVLYFGELVLALIGNATKPTYDTLEIFEYLPNEGRFAPHRIQFNPGRSPVPDDNPQDCLNCHGTKPRPLWGSYYLWPGAYGGLDDAFDHSRTKIVEPPFTEKYFPISDNPEKRKFAEFVSDRKGKGRYRHLAINGNRSLNADFTRFLHAKNRQRILHEWQRSPGFGRYRFAAYAAMLRCNDIESFLPRRRHFETLLADTRKVARSEFGRRLQQYNELNGLALTDDVVTNFELYDADFVARLRYVVEGIGIDVKSWSLSRAAGRNTYSYAIPDGAGGVAELAKDFAASPLAHGVPLAPDPYLYQLGRFEELKQLCEKLRAKSVEALRQEP